MLRTGSLGRALPILLLWAVSGGAQTFTQTLPSAGPTVVVAVSTDPISGVLTNTILTLTSSSPTSTPSSVANSTSSSYTTSSSIPSGIDDPLSHLHSPAPLIAGSLAAFMVLLASVLVAIVARKRKRRRRRSHSLSTRFTANVHDRSIPSRRSSGRTNFTRHSIESPTASIDLPSRPSKKPGPLTHFDVDVEAGGQPGVPRIVVTDGTIHSRTRHHAQNSHSSNSVASTPSLTTSSPETLSSGLSGDVKHPNVLTDQTPALRPSSITTDVHSNSRSASRSQTPIPRTSAAPHDTHTQLLNTRSQDTTGRPSSAISSRTASSIPSDSLSVPSPRPGSLLTPTLRRDNLISLLQQQQDILVLSGSRDARTVSAVALLQEQIAMLRRQQQQEEAILDLTNSEAPPAYEDSVR